MADKIQGKGLIIFSGKQYSGKDTVAKVLLEKMTDYRRFAMGDVIKLEYGKQKGLTYEEIENNKATHRPGLIELGNWGRSQDPDYWLKKIISQPGKIMVTDVRVQHEYDVFKEAGAITIRVEASRETRASRGDLVGETDVTEVGLDHITDWDYVIDNNSDYETLEETAIELIKRLV
jgi:phosphomevalonate kinase